VLGTVTGFIAGTRSIAVGFRTILFAFAGLGRTFGGFRTGRSVFSSVDSPILVTVVILYICQGGQGDSRRQHDQWHLEI